MYNFNRYLDRGEILNLVFKYRKKRFSLYWHLFLLLILFFMIYPLWRFGRQSFYFWAILVVYLFFSLIRDLVKEKNIYLLTNRRLLYLTAINSQDFRIKSSIKLANISRVKKRGSSSLVFLFKGKPYYISKIEKRDQVFNFLQTYLKKENLL